MEKEKNYIECPKCERRVEEGEKNCPYCQYDLVNKPEIIKKEEKRVYQQWWIWVIIAIVVLTVVKNISDDYNANIDTSSNMSNIANNINTTTNNTVSTTIKKVEVKVIDFSQMKKEEIQNWCNTNKIRCSFKEEYSETIGKGLFVSQSSKTESIIYQGDSITITYSLGKEPTMGEKNALSKAKSYLSYSSFSYKGLIEQLKYEGFSDTESIYGVDNCNADWNEQASKKAKSYIEYSSFSKKRLIEQLQYEGFTKEQAEYGTSTVDY